MKNHRLNTLAKKFNVELTQHHRAIYDAEATGYILIKLLQETKEKGILYHDELNEFGKNDSSYKRSRPFHAILLAQTQTGLKNLFKLISIAHVKYFYRVPRIPRSVLQTYREGILVGSACHQGEVFETAQQKSEEELEEVAQFYDYLEVHPKPVYQPLIESDTIQSEEQLESTIKNCTCWRKIKHSSCCNRKCPLFTSRDKIYRKILIGSQGGANPLNRYNLPDVHFRTTDEMLDAFKFLGTDKAKEIVVTNANKIADSMIMCK